MRRYPSNECEVAAFRQLIRFSGFLDDAGQAKKPFLSIDGKTELSRYSLVEVGSV